MKLKEKLLCIQTELNAPKGRKNTYGNYNYRSFEDICEAVKPLLKKHKAGLKMSDSIKQIGDRYYVEATAFFYHAEDLKDRDEEADLIISYGYAREADDKKGMDAAQLTGSASSYARKYALNGLLMIDDSKDPDTDEFKAEADAKAEKPAKSSSKKKAEDVDASDLDKYVTDEQIKTLEMLIKKADVTPEKFCGIYDLTMMSELPADKYEDAVSKLEVAVKAKKAKEQSEKGA